MLYRVSVSRALSQFAKSDNAGCDTVLSNTPAGIGNAPGFRSIMHPTSRQPLGPSSDRQRTRYAGYHESEDITFLRVARRGPPGAHQQVAIFIMPLHGPRGTGGGGGGGLERSGGGSGGGGGGGLRSGSDGGHWAHGGGGPAGGSSGPRGCRGEPRDGGGSRGGGGGTSGCFDDLQAHQGLPSETQNGLVLGTGQGFAVAPLPEEGEPIGAHHGGPSQI